MTHCDPIRNDDDVFYDFNYMLRSQMPKAHLFRKDNIDTYLVVNLGVNVGFFRYKHGLKFTPKISNMFVHIF